jgi:hypothetical protein
MNLPHFEGWRRIGAFQVECGAQGNVLDLWAEELS